MRKVGDGPAERDGMLTHERRGGILVVCSPGGDTLLEEAAVAGVWPLAVAEVKLRWFLLLSWWRFFKRIGRWRQASGGLEEGREGWSALLDPLGEPILEVRESASSEGVVEGEIKVSKGVPADWIRWRLRARKGERFLGFGERFNAVDQTGNKLHVWTEEGAIGLGEKLGRFLEGLPFNPFPNGPTTAYKPMPFFISNRGYGLLLETGARVEYDVAAEDPGVVDIVVWGRSFKWVLFHGPEPSRIVERFTGRTGRATVPSPWVFAPWNDALYGSESVKRTARKLRDNKVPTTAIWTEDWQGGFHLPPVPRKRAAYLIFPIRYRIARHMYPDAEEVAQHLHSEGFRWLSYFFPYILRRSEEYRVARDRGYLLRNRKGAVSHIPILWLPYGQIDLTNAEAREWYTGLLEENLQAGFDGWMADFGEYVPPGSVASSGETGLELHNRFPLLWQSMHRELFDRVRPDGDYVFFCRSASVGSQKYAPVFWSGDSNTDFERYDGLPSNLPAALSAGLCGLPFWATDIGGYMSVTTKGRDRELFFRWTQFASMLPVMRTHHGTHPGRCWTYDSDDETLRMFGSYCRLHTALFPYVYHLAHHASRSGLPAVRHLVLHFPGEPRSWRVEDEFLLGDRMLVAPVVERGARGRRVYFPGGRWVDYWTGRTVEGPADEYVGAPLDSLPLFVRSGKMVPTLDLPVDTLAPVGEDSRLVGLEKAGTTLRLTMYGTGEDRLLLPDGTAAVMWRSPESENVTLGGAVVRLFEGDLLEDTPPDELQPSGRRCEPLLSAGVSGERVDLLWCDNRGNRLAGASVSGGPARERVTFEWR